MALKRGLKAENLKGNPEVQEAACLEFLAYADDTLGVRHSGSRA
jgi:hypothetical protein